MYDCSDWAKEVERLEVLVIDQNRLLRDARVYVAELTKALVFYRRDDERAVEGGILASVFDRPATRALAASDQKEQAANKPGTS